ncbi:MAG: UDP-2,3-diacylglucosamine diphosphatase [Gammaproteobacteria bacterium]
MTTLFISDLHLDANRPEITRLFLDFLVQRANQAEALYILGDLFEAWLGDDDNSDLNECVARGLRQLGDTTAVYFIHGNRDFLLGTAYAEQAHMQLLPEAKIIDLYGQRTLIMHGDTLCTDDIEYQAFRTKVRNPTWQQQILALPLPQRRQLASQLRETSQAATRLKAEEITDVNQQAVLEALQDYQVDLLIHGHTHRPAVHNLDHENRTARRIVLGDWYEQGSVLVCTADGQQLESLCKSSA